jgi:hypothetical protein
MWSRELEGVRMTMLDAVRPARSSATEAVAHAVRTRSLPSLVAFYGQDLTLLACTEAQAASWGTTPGRVCGRNVTEVLTGVEAEQLVPHLLRSVLGATVHVGLRGLDDLGRPHCEQLTLVPYVVAGEQLGVAVLSDDTRAS